MKVVGKQIRCDGCGRLVMEKEPDAKDFRGFFMGPSISLETRRPDGKFPGIARAGASGEMAQLHACPGCQPKIKSMKSSGDINNLPDGPLKRILREIVTGKLLGIH